MNRPFRPMARGAELVHQSDVRDYFVGSTSDDMYALECKDLTKVYGGAVYALGDPEGGVSFGVRRGELFALVGPSGCGKTTTLKIIGGFSAPSSGNIFIGGRDVTNAPPFERPTNTVFQNYALFPHLTVQENVEFGLKMEGIGYSARRDLARAALEALAMQSAADRRIADLSGGQQQRVALARALVKKPEVLLLDEPLGALDLALRKRLQEEIVRLKLSTGTTMVHVTHDQEEACAIADRIAVMNLGQIVQVDRPIDLFRSPRTAFVASFIDAGCVLRGPARVNGSIVEIETADFLVRGPRLPSLHSTSLAGVVRHDKISVAVDAELTGDRINRVDGILEQIQFTGSVYRIFVTTRSGIKLKAAVDAFTASDSLSQSVGRRVVLSWSSDDVRVVTDDDKSTTGKVPTANDLH